ncbi:tRNA (guanosine(46)-N7)-methyltransferase TrmB [Aquibacillus salsiterrae]|uniref:tRNA (guanine-N(7)-)-methyltransferase n=1 Tax=Aquibacillus salsiterrae TaxID=2950439 RepID=A0A9X3WE75_9BACI|nr:tRNA (guanosine(46)-N7)-methyltransferase TrmB [Aquibacillus salsiterrae]MDC3415804.1 tRNA (guanosine(46)-N7)-methyltransferase TrmB [Aquibacillus salsiterrae]
MRARHKPWADEYIQNHENIVVLNPVEQKGKWQQVFGNNNPIHLEIGTGKGQFVTGMATQFPKSNFVGMEVVKSIIVSAIEKVEQSGNSNIRLLNENANDLTEIFSENEVDTIYLNFSDPWPKNKHEKRRLTYASFLNQYRYILKDGGKVILKSDNKGLFEYSVVSFSKNDMVLDEVLLDLHAEGDPTNVLTEYEEKFSSQGQPIYRCKSHFKS